MSTRHHPPSSFVRARKRQRTGVHTALLVRRPGGQCAGSLTRTQRLMIEIFTVFAIALAWNLLAGTAVDRRRLATRCSSA